MTSSTFRQRILPLFVFLALLATTFASPTAFQERDLDIPDPRTGPYNVSPLTWQPVILGIVAIASGIYFGFFGYRFFRFTMYITGAWLFGNMAYIILSNVGVTNSTVLIIVPIVIGLVLGLLLAFCYQIGIYILGALFGLLVALWILSFRPGGLIPGHIGQAIFILIVCNIGIILCYFYERFILIIGTSFVGAFLIMFGIEIFVQTGYGIILFGIIHPQGVPSVNLPWQIYGMLAAVFVLFFICIAVQYATSWKKLGADYRAGVPVKKRSGCCRGKRERQEVV